MKNARCVAALLLLAATASAHSQQGTSNDGKASSSDLKSWCMTSGLCSVLNIHKDPGGR
jgi:hypothetical protein